MRGEPKLAFYYYIITIELLALLMSFYQHCGGAAGGHVRAATQDCCRCRHLMRPTTNSHGLGPARRSLLCSTRV